MADITIQRAALPADQYLIITNEMARGKFAVPLHCGARCLLLHLLSLRPGWSTSRPQLDTSFAEGRDYVSKAIRELRQAGYLRQDKHRGSAGRWLWTWHVTDDPIERPLGGTSADVRESNSMGSRTSPSTDIPSMDPTSSPATKPQVAPHTDRPSTVTQSITEDRSQKIEKKTTPLRGAGADDSAAQPTVNRRAQRLARVYTDRVKLANFPAVMAIAKKAIETGDYTDEQIAVALARLAEDRRGVSTESLRIELEGLPAPRSRSRLAASTTDERVRQAETLRDDLVGATWDDVLRGDWAPPRNLTDRAIVNLIGAAGAPEVFGPGWLRSHDQPRPGPAIVEAAA